MKNVASQRGRRTAWLCLCLAAWVPGVAAGASGDDLFDLSIEELVGLEVTTVSRKAERLTDTASAVYVITQEDIQRYGIRTIPDALRLAPGLTVHQLDASKWAVSSRGETGRFANKLLVLMDGRMLYTSSFSGVYWEVTDTLIEDIDRIEVVRGPGAVAWGTNAVNGVINIITRSASAKDGRELAGGVDPLGTRFASASYSGALSPQTAWRAFAKYQDADSNALLSGGQGADDWHMLRAGFRTDSSRSDADITFIGEAYSGEIGKTVQSFMGSTPQRSSDPFDAQGAYVLARLSLNHSDTRTSSGQFIFDYNDLESALFSEQRASVSLEGQHQRSAGRHDLVVGGWARVNTLNLVGSPQITYLGDIDRDYFISVFVQDDIDVTDALRLNVGLKLEHNSLSPNAVEFMPSLRGLWRISERHTVWGAVTRAVRTPNWGDSSVESQGISPDIPVGAPGNPFPLPIRTPFRSNPAPDSTSNLATEIGLRGRIGDNLSYDLALFNARYRDLPVNVSGAPVCSATGTPVQQDPACLLSSEAVIARITNLNEGEATARGGELALDWLVTAGWRLRGTLSYYSGQTREPGGVEQNQDDEPSWQVGVRSEWSPSDTLGVALWARYVDDMPSVNVDGYWQANINARWQPDEHWIVSLGVRNLLDDDNYEFRSEFIDVTPTLIPRTTFLNLRYSF